MASNIKALGLALCALVLLSAATAMSAPAQIIHDFKAESVAEEEKEKKSIPFIVTGEQLATEAIKYEIGEGGFTLECSVEKLNGTQKSSSPASITVEPTHEGCNAGGTPVTVDNEGCRYFVDGATDANGHAQMHVECEAGSKTRITLTGCTIEIGEQTPGGGVHYTKSGSGKNREIFMQVTTSNIKYSLIGLLCGAIGGTGNDLSMRGTYTMAAYKDNGGKEGERIGLYTEETIK